MTKNNLICFVKEYIEPLTCAILPTANSDTIDNEQLDTITAFAGDIINRMESRDWDAVDICSRALNLFLTVGFYSHPERYFNIDKHFVADAISSMISTIGVPKKKDLLSNMDEQLETCSNIVIEGSVGHDDRLLISRLLVLKFMFNADKTTHSEALRSDYNSCFDKLPESLKNSEPELHYFLSSIKDDGRVFFTSINIQKRFNQSAPVIDKHALTPVVESIKSEDPTKDIYLIVSDHATMRDEHIKQLTNETDNLFYEVISDRNTEEVNDSIVRQCLPGNFYDVLRRITTRDPSFIVVDINAYGMGTGATEMLSQVSDMGYKLVVYLEPILPKFDLNTWISEHFREKQQYDRLVVSDLRTKA